MAQQPSAALSDQAAPEEDVWVVWQLELQLAGAGSCVQLPGSCRDVRVAVLTSAMCPVSGAAGAGGEPAVEGSISCLHSPSNATSFLMSGGQYRPP
jgi:hypothetical protein